MNKVRVYFDHNATTPVSDRIIEILPQVVRDWGNPSSIHWEGRAPKTMLREARQKVADALGGNPLEFVFTSGGTEANNAAIKGVFFNKGMSLRNEYITTRVEHPSVLRCFDFIKSQGAVVHYLEVSRKGEIDLQAYRELLSEKTALVSVMYANNETGVIFPIQEMAALAHEKKALFHTDAVQALGKIPFKLKDLGVDFASFSAHKFYALKGTGVLYLRRGVDWSPLIHGGAQERYRRGGTENILGIFAFGMMMNKLKDVPLEMIRLQKLRNHLERRVLDEVSGVSLTHGEALRLPNTSSFVLLGVDGETLLMSLDINGFSVSTGAACSSGNPEPSPTLLAVGLNRAEAQSSLRVSLGLENTMLQVDQFVESLKATVKRLRSLALDLKIKSRGVEINV